MQSFNWAANIFSARAIPDIAPRKMNGYQPSNCGQPESERTGLSKREAYGAATAYIEKDIFHNCCTIEADNRVKCWKATVLPVKLKKVDRRITLIYSELLNLQPSE